ncbi:hypothetical protein B0H10DRAFT_1988360 [Mycena sp. CBHHK59/15]|nr:hypothetical protein B0H10DRAFT_1988360 [Mycena sp. CBHHK59/15]
MGVKFSATSATSADEQTVCEPRFSPPHLLPVPSNVLVIKSYHSMRGGRFGFALLYSPHPGTAGIAIDTRGRLSSISDYQWEKLVQGAKEICAEEHASSWSRPTSSSCPVSRYYDLGPSVNNTGLSTFTLTAHYQADPDLRDLLVNYLKSESREGVSTKKLDAEDTDRIIAHKKVGDRYEEVKVKEIPEQIRKLESALTKLENELWPESSTK